MTDLQVGDVVLLLQELQDGLVDGVLLGGQKEPADWNPEILDTSKDNPTLKNKGIIVLIKNWQTKQNKTQIEKSAGIKENNHIVTLFSFRILAIKFDVQVLSKVIA